MPAPERTRVKAFIVEVATHACTGSLRLRSAELPRAITPEPLGSFLFALVCMRLYPESCAKCLPCFPQPGADVIYTGRRRLSPRGPRKPWGLTFCEVRGQESGFPGGSLKVFDIFFGKYYNKMVLASFQRASSDLIILNSHTLTSGHQGLGHSRLAV